ARPELPHALRAQPQGAGGGVRRRVRAREGQARGRDGRARAPPRGADRPRDHARLRGGPGGVRADPVRSAVDRSGRRRDGAGLVVGLELFPDGATIDGAGELTIGGLRATELAAEHGTPLVVYCEDTVRAQARAYRTAAPEALVVYGTKAFPNVALL